MDNRILNFIDEKDAFLGEVNRQEVRTVSICDHTSVGMFVWKDERLLLIERAKFPFGFAVPAGHVDGDSSYEESARRELREEVGLEADGLKLLTEGRKENQCRREGGSWHYWKMYEVVTMGDIKRSEDETKQAGWYSKEQIQELGNKTKRYLDKEITENDWKQNPGLEPVMYEWFIELGII